MNYQEIERFWRSIKQEWVYPNPADTMDEQRCGINRFIKFNNYKRPRQSLDELLPAIKNGIVAYKCSKSLALSANMTTFAMCPKRLPCLSRPEQVRVALLGAPPCSEINCLTLSKKSGSTINNRIIDLIKHQILY